jgi:restriction endonuclease Mrr
VTVPDFQSLMRPLLEEYADEGERPIREVRAALATRLGLTQEDLAQRLPSGSFRAAAEATLRDPYTVPGTAFKVELAKRTIVRILQTVSGVQS